MIGRALKNEEDINQSFGKKYNNIKTSTLLAVCSCLRLFQLAHSMTFILKRFIEKKLGKVKAKALYTVISLMKEIEEGPATTVSKVTGMIHKLA